MLRNEGGRQQMSRRDKPDGIPLPRTRANLFSSTAAKQKEGQGRARTTGAQRNNNVEGAEEGANDGDGAKLAAT